MRLVIPENTSYDIDVEEDLVNFAQVLDTLDDIVCAMKDNNCHFLQTDDDLGEKHEYTIEEITKVKDIISNLFDARSISVESACPT